MPSPIAFVLFTRSAEGDWSWQPATPSAVIARLAAVADHPLSPREAAARTMLIVPMARVHTAAIPHCLERDGRVTEQGQRRFRTADSMVRTMLRMPGRVPESAE